MRRTPVAAAVAISLALGAASGESLRDRPETLRRASRVGFERNLGQAAPEALAIARAGGVTTLVRSRGATFLVRGAEAGAFDAVRMEIEGAGGGAARFGGTLGGRSHYFRGADPRGWIRGVPRVADLEVAGSGSGASVAWGSREGLVAWDLRVPAGADASALAVRFEGAAPLALAAGGALAIPVSGGTLLHGAPRAWQVRGGARVPVAARWEIRGPDRAGFALGPRDRCLPLVVDPHVRFVARLGGAGADGPSGAVLDPAGRLLLCGGTASTDFPAGAGALQVTHAGVADAFVTALDPDTGEIAWSTFLGGTGSDSAASLAADGSGVAVCGFTSSADFPVKNALDAVNGLTPTGIPTRWEDAFVARLAAEGDALLWSTLLGGNAERDFASGVLFAADGSLRVCGGSMGTTNPGAGSLPVLRTGNFGPVTVYNWWVASLATDGSSMPALLALGTQSWGTPSGMVLAPDGDLVLVGQVIGVFAPVLAPFQDASGDGSWNAWIAKVKGDLSGARWASCWGGPGSETSISVAVDPEGEIFVAGNTSPGGIPGTAGTFGPTVPGGSGSLHAFLARIAGDGSAPRWAAYLGGAGGESFQTRVVAPGDGTVSVSGTSLGAFPVTSPLAGLGGSDLDTYVRRVDDDGSAVRQSFRWGGAGFDQAPVLLAREGRFLVALSTDSADLPGSVGGARGAEDVALFEFGPALPPATDAAAVFVAPATARVSWSAGSLFADGFRVEFRVDGGPWQVLGSADAPTTHLDHADLAPGSAYRYRVVAFREDEEAAPSGEALLVSTLVPPVDLVATPAGPREIDLSWSDSQQGPTGYGISRAEEDGDPLPLATPGAAARSHVDDTVLPDRRCAYRVRALGPFVASAWSAPASARAPATLAVELRSARIRLAGPSGRGKAALTADLAALDGAPEEGFDPRRDGLSVLLGGWDGATLLEIPPGDDGWRQRRRALLHDATGEGGVRVQVKFDPGTGRLKAKVTGADIPSSPAPRLCTESGGFAGSREGAWKGSGRSLRWE